MADWNQQIIDEFRANDGTVETMGFGRGLVLVHHLGARSGEERINPVANIREDDGSRLIAASAAGPTRTPTGTTTCSRTPTSPSRRPTGWSRST